MTIHYRWVGVLVAAACLMAFFTASAEAAEAVQEAPTVLDLILAWAVKAATALCAGVVGALGLVAAVRRIPWIQELLMPSADELRLLGVRLEERVRAGRPLTQPEAIVAAGLAVRCGLTLLAALVFAGLLLLRL